MYASNSTLTMALVVSLFLSSPVVFAQNAGGGGGTRLRSPTVDRTRDRLHERMVDRLYQRDLVRERDRDRIYGGNLMSAAERTHYEQRLHSLATERDRVQFRLEHQRDMQRRAEARRQRLGPAPSEARIRTEERQRQQEREQIYGYSMMTPQEVARYQAQMGAARSQQERERIRAEHRTQMERRVRERGDSRPQ